MATMKCKTCGGEYVDVLPDGLRYFHACPPIERAHIERLGVQSDIDAKDVKVGDTVLKTFAIQRPNARDENVVITGYDKSGDPITAMKSAGAGVDKI